MQRLLLIAASFAIVLAAYWVYASVAVPWIEPAAPGYPGQNGLIPPEGADGPIDYRLKPLVGLFPRNAWELKNPIIFESPRGDKVLLQKYKNLGNGQVKIRPCTLVVLPDGPVENEEQRKRQTVILEAPQGAILQFDSPLDLKTMKIGRLVGGKLLGKIIIRSKGKDPGPDDDLRIVTRDVHLTESDVWTEQPVAFRWGKTFGRGRRMRIKLQPGPPAPGDALAGPSASGIEQFDLLQLDRLHIEVPPSTAAAGGNPPSSLPSSRWTLASQADRRPLEVTCRGPFTFRRADWSAKFHDHVEVRRLNSQGPADQVLCDVLTLYFAPRDSGIDPATASPSDMEPYRVEARGQPTFVNAPSQDITAQGDRLEYNLRENRIVLEGGREVFLKKGVNEIHARRVDYQSLGPHALGKAVAEGPGWLRGSTPHRPQQRLKAIWNGQLQLYPENKNQVISLSGDAELDYTGLGHLKAQEIFFWLVQAPQMNGSESPTWRPDRMLARKNVEIQSPQLSGLLKEQLEVQFEPKATGQGVYEKRKEGKRNISLSLRNTKLPAAPAYNATLPLAPRQALQKHTVYRPPFSLPDGNRPPSNSASPAPQRHFHITARSLKARVKMLGEQGELDELTIVGDVHCKETQTHRPDERPMQITGDRVHVVDASGPRSTATLLGRPARCEGRGWTAVGANINLHSGENRLWIDGAGQMVLPENTAQNDTALLPGRLPAQSGPMTIQWQRRMHFDGLTAKFEGQTLAFTPTQRVETETLEVQLDRTILFNDPNLQNQPQPQAEKIFCKGRVLLENRGRNQNGQTLSRDRMQMTDLKLNLRNGELSAGGPGEIHSVHYGRSLQGQLPLAGSTGNRHAPDAANATPPDAEPPTLHCLRVQFDGSMTGNLHQKHVELHHEVHGAYAPVNSWEATLVLDQPEALGPQGITFECDRLAADQVADPRGGPPSLEFIAQGNTVVESQRYTARALRITYAEAKGLLILEGDGRTDVELYYQKQIGGMNQHVAGRKIEYWIKTNRLKGIDLRSIEVR